MIQQYFWSVSKETTGYIYELHFRHRNWCPLLPRLLALVVKSCIYLCSQFWIGCNLIRLFVNNERKIFHGYIVLLFNSSNKTIQWPSIQFEFKQLDRDFPDCWSIFQECLCILHVFRFRITITNRSNWVVEVGYWWLSPLSAILNYIKTTKLIVWGKLVYLYNKMTGENPELGIHVGVLKR